MAMFTCMDERLMAMWVHYGEIVGDLGTDADERDT